MKKNLHIIAVQHKLTANQLFGVVPVLIKIGRNKFCAAGYGDDIEQWNERLENSFLRLDKPISIDDNYGHLIEGKYYDLPYMAVYVPQKYEYLIQGTLPAPSCNFEEKNFYIFDNYDFHGKFVPRASELLKKQFDQISGYLASINSTDGTHEQWEILKKVANGRVKLLRDRPLDALDAIAEVGFTKLIGPRKYQSNCVQQMDDYLHAIHQSEAQSIVKNKMDGLLAVFYKDIKDYQNNAINKFIEKASEVVKKVRQQMADTVVPTIRGAALKKNQYNTALPSSLKFPFSKACGE